jgi:hypothetical protein
VEDNIKMGLIEMGGGVGAVAGSCGCGDAPPGSIKVRNFLTSFVRVNSSSSIALYS